jgi:transcriptional regulator with XRE-family HTH domain
VETYQERLGQRLRAIRQQQGLTLQQVEEKSQGDWKAVVVGSYERGDRSVSVAKLADLANFYGVPVSELLPEDEVPRPDAGTDVPPRVIVDLTALNRNGETEPALKPISRYVTAIQVQRGDYNGRMLTIRGEDLKALAIVLGIDPDTLIDKLDERGILLHT